MQTFENGAGSLDHKIARFVWPHFKVKFYEMQMNERLIFVTESIFMI